MRVRLITTESLPGNLAAVAWGITDDSSKIVRVVCDKTEAAHYADRLDCGELVDLTIEPWQVIDVSERPKERRTLRPTPHTT